VVFCNNEGQVALFGPGNTIYNNKIRDLSFRKSLLILSMVETFQNGILAVACRLGLLDYSATSR
jgi:hypothetical protein